MTRLRTSKPPKRPLSEKEHLMTIRRITSFLLAICLLAAPVSAFAAGAAGSATDPLISKNYADTTFSEALLKAPLQNLTDSFAFLQYKLSTALAGSSSSSVPAGGSISLSSGASFTLLSGSAKLTSLTGTLIDITSGETVSAGSTLSARHRYIAGAGSFAFVSVTSSLKADLSGSAVVSSNSMVFTDVQPSDWHYEYVLYSYTSGLINGKSNTVFDPNNNLTIAEAIKLAACMHQLYNEGSVSLVNGTGNWYSTYVSYASQNNITTKTYSNYDAFITRNEFVSIFYSALPSSEFPQINSVAENSIPDVKSNSTHAASIYAFYRAGILNGSDSKGTFNPSANILRSEVAAIVTRMFEKSHRVSITLT